MNETSSRLTVAAIQAKAAECFQAGRFDDAIRLFHEAVIMAPGTADLYYNLGTAQAAAGDHESAVDSFRIGLDFRPHDAAALNNLGNSLIMLDRRADAERAFAQALKYDRRNATIIGNRANNLNLMALGFRERGAESEALSLLELAVKLRPEFAEGWNNLGIVLHDLRRLDDSEEAIRKALALRPDYSLAIGSLANLLLDKGWVSEALEHYREFAVREPDSPNAHWNLALALLSSGDLESGFREFEWRMALPQATALYPAREAPLWQGEALSEKRILVYAEQGLGDSLQFVRYMPKLASLGAEVWVEIPQALKTLICRVSGISGVVVSGDAVPAQDYVCPMMSLPYRFHTTLDSIPSRVPYLSIEENRLAVWRERIAAVGGEPRVGVVWAGEARAGQPDAYRIDRRRSLRIDDLAPLFDIEGIQFFSLQKGVPALQLPESRWAGKVIDWSADFLDMQETGALICHLDLVIGVDTSVIHLSGGLGRPTWVLSRFDGCWRWLRDRSDSPWYPTLRLFRQQRPLEWRPVIERVACALREWSASFGSTAV